MKIVLVLSLFFSANISTHPTKWAETNKQFFSDCFNKEFVEEELVQMNPALLVPICTFSRILEIRAQVIHGCRKLRSYHHGCNALDFYFDNYLSADKCMRMTALLNRYRQFVRYLDSSKTLYFGGLGVYPHNKYTPAIHWDLRGFGVFWGRLGNGKYVYFKGPDEQEEWLIAQIHACDFP